MGPEQKRLEDRLFGDPTRQLRNFSITRGSGAATAEEVCREVNKALDETERRVAAGDVGDGPASSGTPKVNARSLMEDL